MCLALLLQINKNNKMQQKKESLRRNKKRLKNKFLNFKKQIKEDIF